MAGAANAAAAATAAERSLLRNLIPFRVEGAGAQVVLLRHALLNREQLIYRILGALERVPLPAHPRVVMAEAVQTMLDAEAPQRDVRKLFENAEVECRKVLLDMDFDDTGAGIRDPYELQLRRHTRSHAHARLLMLEMRAACCYYAQFLSVSSAPLVGASVAVQTIISSDARKDPVLSPVTLAFDDLKRNVETGERLEEAPEGMDDFIKEMLLLERDAFGQNRFDPHTDLRFFFHHLKLAELGKTRETYSTLIDPLVRKYGNFTVREEEVFKRRWMRYYVSCGDEDHRVDPDLPDMETVTLRPGTLGDGGAVDELGLSMNVYYNTPVCLDRFKKAKGNTNHVEEFDLAIEDKDRTFWERYFLDR